MAGGAESMICWSLLAVSMIWRASSGQLMNMLPEFVFWLCRLAKSFSFVSSYILLQCNDGWQRVAVWWNVSKLGYCGLGYYKYEFCASLCHLQLTFPSIIPLETPQLKTKNSPQTIFNLFDVCPPQALWSSCRGEACQHPKIKETSSWNDETTIIFWNTR
jgi:hypothetical protein